MHLLVQVTLFFVIIGVYLVQIGAAPGLFKFAPEAIAGIVALAVILYGARTRFQFMRLAYWFAGIAAILVIVCGAVANHLEPGPLVAGLRAYLRPLPLFLLPIVFVFTDREVRSQLLLVLVLALPQLPLAIYQKSKALSYGNPSGDTVTGTLQLSGTLSIFLIGATCVLTAAWLHKRVPLKFFLPMFLLLLAPTTFNETKATVFMLPAGLLMTFLAAAKPGARLKYAVRGGIVLAIFGSIFVPIYDYYATQQMYSKPLLEFFTEEKGFDEYMSRNAGIGSTRRAGRVDAIRTPLKEMAREPTHFAFGLGVGNASQSSLGRQFDGKYFLKFAPFLQSSASFFILEMGMLGLALAFLVYWHIYRDSRLVAEVDDGWVGTLAVGWSGVIAVVGIATFYVNFMANEGLGYLFWYFSGLVAARRMQLAYSYAPAVSAAGVRA